jgi:hypothetical protein
VIVHWIVGINQLMSGCRHVLILVESTMRWWTLAYCGVRVHLMVL